MKRFVIGDIHGNAIGLKQVLKESNFDYDNDLLITLGDIADGWSEVFQCVEELLKIKNRIDIRGNHDEWFYDFLTLGYHPVNWKQGGYGTGLSYVKAAGLDEKKITRDVDIWHNKDYGFIMPLKPSNVPQLHIDFFQNQKMYYKDADNNVFVHGGFNRHFLLDNQDQDLFCWDRDLWLAAIGFSEMIEGFKFRYLEEIKHVFIGHTTTLNYETDKPIEAANITNIDTGSGFYGRLTLMNVDNRKEYYQSELANKLYPNEKGRL